MTICNKRLATCYFELTLIEDLEKRGIAGIQAIPLFVCLYCLAGIKLAFIKSSRMGYYQN